MRTPPSLRRKNADPGIQNRPHPRPACCGIFSCHDEISWRAVAGLVSGGHVRGRLLVLAGLICDLDLALDVVFAGDGGGLLLDVLFFFFGAHGTFERHGATLRDDLHVVSVGRE